MIEQSIDIPVDVPLLPYKVLTIGDLTIMYEAGNLRYIKCGGVELLRMIYGAFRDQNWETVIPTITEESWTENDKEISISYQALYHMGDIQYKGAFEISINSNNRIVFTMKGTALSSFKKNRIGLCVLHPLECKGKTVEITKPNGDIYNAVFPELIAPHQPFKNIQRMQWEAAEGLQVQLAFLGEIFETEDQRNWSDSSYKTYSTPLDMPFPALVMEGETLQQQIILTVTGNTKQQVATMNTVKKLDKEIALPKVGYCRPANQNLLSDEQVKRVKEKAPDHWRAELRFNKTGWQDELAAAGKEVQLLRTKLELILFFTNDYEAQIQLFLQAVKGMAQNIYSILLLDIEQNVTPATLMLKGMELIKAAYPFIKIGYGTDGFFADLNRNRPGDLPCDFVNFSLTPMVHAKDPRTVIENLESQPDIIKTIRSFTNKEIHISPLTINIRRDAGTTTDKNLLAAEDLLAQSDFGEAWISFAIQQLSEADSITIALSNKE